MVYIFNNVKFVACIFIILALAISILKGGFSALEPSLGVGGGDFFFGRGVAQEYRYKI